MLLKYLEMKTHISGDGRHSDDDTDTVYSVYSVLEYVLYRELKMCLHTFMSLMENSNSSNASVVLCRVYISRSGLCAVFTSMRKTLFSRAAETSCLTSLRFMAKGFSHSTFFPALRNSRPTCRWCVWRTPMYTTSDRRHSSVILRDVLFNSVQLCLFTHQYLDPSPAPGSCRMLLGRHEFLQTSLHFLGFLLQLQLSTKHTQTDTDRQVNH